jgi:hypothetical protein
MSLTRAAGDRTAAVPRLDDGLRAGADAKAETARRDLAEARRAHGQRRGRACTRSRWPVPLRAGRRADHGQRREAVEPVHLERPRIGVALAPASRAISACSASVNPSIGTDKDHRLRVVRVSLRLAAPHLVNCDAGAGAREFGQPA